MNEAIWAQARRRTRVIGEGSGVVKWRIERFGSRSTLEHVAIIEGWMCGRMFECSGLPVSREGSVVERLRWLCYDMTAASSGGRFKPYLGPTFA